MAMTINDLDDDEEVISYQEQANLEEEKNFEQPTNDDSFISDFLKTKGIEDPEKIKFYDDNEQIIERSWNDLTKEEKFNILNTLFTQEEPQEAPEDNLLTLEEIEFINLLRQNNLTPQQYVESLQPQELEPQYDIDKLDDDEIYILDLESRVGELSDDEAANALSIAKQNEEFFKKLVDGIRNEYKRREDEINQQKQATVEEELRQAFEEYQTSVIDSILNFNSIGLLDLNLDDLDKEELARFMLEPDETGKLYLYLALQEPETLTKVAWFILHGDEAFDNVTDYFSKLIKTISENQYKKGLEDGAKGLKPKPTVIIDNSKKTTNVHRSYKTIDELDDDE